MKGLLILVCLIGVSFAHRASINNDAPEISTPSGRILGSIIQSRLGRRIFSFRGIRYAKAPVGERRFKVPELEEPWRGVYNATVDGPRCPGLDKNFVSEDCLLLNVYTTKLPSTHAKAGIVKRPVLVFFHPGGFYAYTGRSDIFGPQYLMDEDLVLVTVSYRLATLGLISTGDAYAPGNLAFKDQVVALRWIQRNIASFGGDPNCVTISGYSAGSMSVLFHMISPMSTGLFHRAIAQSAGLPVKEALPTHQTELAHRQARLIGCPTDTNDAMFACLMSKPVEDYLDTVGMLFEWYGDPILEWSPVVEPAVEGLERFIPEQPYDMIKRGVLNPVPLILGVTKDEFGGVVVGFETEVRKGNYSLFDQINENWQTLMPISYMYERGTPRSLEISRALREFYFNNEPLSPASYDGIANIYADSVIIMGVHRTGQLMAQYMQESVYFYEFTFQGRRSFSMWNDTTPYGVVHHDDLQYLYYLSFIFPYLQPSDPEVPMLERMTAIWMNFMITGEPIPRNDPKFENVCWERYNPSKDNYLNLNLQPKMETGLYPERMQLWDRLFPLDRLSTSVKH